MPTSGAAETPRQQVAAREALRELARAALAADRDAFDDQLSTKDPGFAATAAMLYDNLSGLELSQFSFDLSERTGTLSAERAHVLGDGAWVGSGTVSWQVAGDRDPARHTVWLTFVTEVGRTKLAGTIDSPDPADRLQQPLWLLEPITAAQQGRATVIAHRGVDLGPWLTRTDRAGAAVEQRLDDEITGDWHGQVVVEVPSNQDIFAEMLGVDPESYDGIAAVSWPEGPDPADAPIRIIVNPGSASQLPDLGLDILLTHEAVHVATAAVDNALPTWLEEGLADFVALAAHPAGRESAAETLLAEVKAGGAPKSLPADPDFDPGSPTLNVVYAQSWLACRYLAETYGVEKLILVYAAVEEDGGEVEQAFQQVLGVSVAEFTDGWRVYLETAADQS